MAPMRPLRPLVPNLTDGFSIVEESVSVPDGVEEVRLVLSGFSATDTRTSGTITFDDVGLYAE